MTWRNDGPSNSPVCALYVLCQVTNKVSKSAIMEQTLPTIITMLILVSIFYPTHL